MNFDLPESAVAHETRNVVYDLVRENSQRGVTREMIEKQKDEIYSAATHNAKERVKLAFLIQRIAEQEKIKVSQEEVLKRAQSLAAMYQIPLGQIPQGFAEAQRRDRALRPGRARKGAGVPGTERAELRTFAGGGRNRAPTPN